MRHITFPKHLYTSLHTINYSQGVVLIIYYSLAIPSRWRRCLSWLQTAFKHCHNHQRQPGGLGASDKHFCRHIQGQAETLNICPPRISDQLLLMFW